MMKLIVSLTLIWTLSSTAEALQCWDGHGTDIKQQDLRPCNSTDLCATVASHGYENGSFTQSTFRKCLPFHLFSEGKHTFSFNEKLVSVHVCNTDGCNNQVIPYPAVQKKNNLQCFICDDESPDVCNKTVQCVGMEDRCFNGTMGDIHAKGPYHTFGCISANLCENTPRLEFLIDAKFLHAPKCCGSSFCNSSWSVKLNLIPLLFGLITLVVF